MSIVLPAYNSEEWIERAVDSVLNQKTKFTYELILVDDGSEDSTGRIIDNYSNYENIHIIHQNNRVFSGARNAALDKAVGRYIMFIDSDDVLLPGAIEALMDCAVEKEADVVCGNYMRIYKSGKKKSGSYYSLEKINPAGKLYGQPYGKVYARRLFFNLRFPLGYWYEDSIFGMIVWPQCNTCYTISQDVYGWFQNERGITTRSKESVKSIDSLYIMASLLKDKERFGLKITSDDFDEFLRTVRLTLNRTSFLELKVQKAIFVAECDLRDSFFREVKISSANQKIADALSRRDYRAFVRECMKDYIKRRF